jgi:hypothetical protein
MAIYGSYLVRHDELNNETHVYCRKHGQWDCLICQEITERKCAVRKALELLTTMERELSRVGVRTNFDGLRDELEEVLEGGQ